MTSALDTRPSTELTDAQDGERPTLADLASLAPEELAVRLRRALPGAASGLIPVAAFNSSI